MKLKDVLNVVYEECDFILYTQERRVGMFRKNDKGIEEYKESNIEIIEPNDNKSITITIEED